MAALTAERMPIMFGEGVHPKCLSYGVKASVKIYKGALVVINSGYLAPGTSATSLIAAGVATETVDNTSGGNAAKTCEIMTGVFDFANASGDELLVTDVGATAYISDDQTVAKTASGKSAAGKVIKVENSRVYVLIGVGV
jgi:hypothetical protein